MQCAIIQCEIGSRKPEMTVIEYASFNLSVLIIENVHHVPLATLCAFCCEMNSLKSSPLHLVESV